MSVVSPPPPAHAVTSPLWRLWLPLVVASGVVGGLLSVWAPRGAEQALRPATHWHPVAEERGVREPHRPTRFPDAPAPSTLGAGVVAADFDQDGRTDLFALQGGAWPWEETGGRSSDVAGRLYRNLGDGHFVEITTEAGVTPTFLGMAAAAGDYDRDGFPDLAVVGVGGCQLYRNQGNGTFRNTTEEAHWPQEVNSWHTGLVWLDVDHDGWLDAVLTTYARWPEGLDLSEALAVAAGGRTYGTPTGLYSVAPTVLLNRRDGTFSPAPGAGGLELLDPETRRPRPWALGAVPVDANDDVWPDLLLLFGTGENQLLLGRAEGGFRPVPFGAERRQEGNAAIAGSAWWEEQGGGGETRSRHLIRLAASVTPSASLATRLAVLVADFNDDGQDETFFLAGGLEPEPAPDLDPAVWRTAEGVLQVEGGASLLEPQAWNQPALGRALASLDLEGDGDLDVWVSRWADVPLLLLNEPRQPLPWLAVDLRPSPGQATPYGARVEVHTPRQVQRKTHLPQVGLFAQSEEVLRFGLGSDSRVRKVVVLWPDGQRTEVRSPALGQVLRLAPP